MKSLICLIAIMVCAIGLTANAEVVEVQVVGVTIEPKAEPANCGTCCPTPIQDVLEAMRQRVKERPVVRRLVSKTTSVVKAVEQRVKERPLMRKVRQRTRCMVGRVRCCR